MRILMITNLCPPYTIGGYEIACLNVARGLVALGHDVLLATTPSHIPGPPDPSFVRRNLDLRHFDSYELPQSVRALKVHESTCSHFTNTAALVQLLRSFGPDVVYCWNLVGLGGLALLDILNLVGAPWAMHLMDRVPVELSRHSPKHVRHIFHAVGSELYARGTIISMSQHLVDEIRHLSGVDFGSDVHFVPGWVNTDGLDARREYCPGGVTRFVSAGAIKPHKGIDLILKAAAALADRNLDAFRIDFFGEGQVGHYVDMAMALGISDRVRFLGARQQSELLRLYASYDAFLFPTWEREPFGFVPIEAAASGCVPVLTRNCGVSERLVDLVHCLKIDRTVADLTNALAAIVSHEVDLPRLGAAASALVRSDLSFSKCLNSIERILRATCRDWNRERLDDDRLMLLAYVKHHLALEMRFNPKL